MSVLCCDRSSCESTADLNTLPCQLSVPAVTLVRLLLDHLADWAVASSALAYTRQATLDGALEPSLARLRTRLAAIEPTASAVQPVLVGGPGAGKKRKASVGVGAGELGVGRGTKPRLGGEGVGAAVGARKLSAGARAFAPKETGEGDGAGQAVGGVDRLSALELLMREARGLLGAK